VIAICTATLLADPMTAGEDEVRAAGEAAQAAGFTEASVWAHHIPALDGTGLHVAVVEAATAWANADADTASTEARHLASMVAEHGATKVVAVCLDMTVRDIDHARGNLAALVDTVSEAGAQVCVEFLPWSGIPDLATAWSLVEPLGDGAAILLDTWHWVRQPGGPALALLAAIPGVRIGYVQLCDAAAEPSGDTMTEAMTARLLPGDGVVDFAGVLSTLEGIGARPMVATEIFNPTLVTAKGAEVAAIDMMEAAHRVGWGTGRASSQVTRRGKPT
jgi:sugar phosphate isomerase/epimerase